MMEIRTDSPINGRYRLVRSLGRGAMGEVFLAQDLSAAGQQVALKILRPTVADDGEGLRVEFGAMTRLRHPNLVAVHDFGTIAGQDLQFLTMEHVAGGSLQEASLPLSAEVVFVILEQICRALDYIHARGMLHHDLKPGNLLVAGELDAEAVVKLCDFGLASPAGKTGGEFGGTPVYMAPERFTGGSVDRRADLYSLGAVLFHLLCGAPPFDDGDGHGLLDRILHGPPTFPSPAGPGVPPALQVVVQKLMDPRPGRRYPSAAAVIEAVNRLAGAALRLDADAGGSLVRHAPLAGREPERRRLLRWIEQMRQDASSGPWLIAVRGETGIGKSRLLEEARVGAQLAGVEVLDGSFSEAAASPFGPWPEILGRALGKIESLTPDLDDDAELAPLRRALAPVLPELGLPTDRARPVVGAGAEGRRRLSATAGLLRAAAARFPVLLILEDLPAADPPDLRILRRLGVAAARVPLRVLVSLDDDEADGTAGAGFVDSRVPSVEVEELRLGPLSPRDQERMVASILGIATPPRALLERLKRGAAGNPLFVEEMLRTLVDEAALVRAPEGWRLEATRLARVPEPRTTQELVLQRLRRLDPAERRAVELLAVAGGTATSAVLRAVAAPHDDEVKDALQRLTERGVVHDSTSEEESGFTFRHDLMQRTAYEGCHHGRRRSLHRRFARHLEEQEGVATEELARHLAGAAETERALKFTRRAAEEAVQLHAHERAIGLYQRALELAPRTERSVLLEALAEVHEAVGANRRAVETLRRALGESPSPEKEARIAARIGRNASLAGDYDDAEEAIGVAIERFRGLSDLAGEAGAHKSLGVTCARRNDFERAERCYERAIGIYRDLDDRDGIASLLNNLGLLRSFRGDHEEAVQKLEQARSIRQEMGDRRGELGTLINLGFVRNRQMHHAAAATVLEESVALAREVGDQQNEGNARTFLAESLRAQGKLDGALRALEAALQVHQETGDDARQIDCQDRIGELHRILGDVATAAEHHRRAVELARENDDPVQEAFALASLGLDRLGLGEPAAVDDLQVALEAGRSRSPRAEARALRGLALAEAMRGRWDEMAARADRLIVVAESGGLAGDHAWGLRLLGEAQLGRRDLEAGRRTLREAARAAGRLHHPELEREVLLLLSDSYHRGGRMGDALEAQQRAQAILEEMAMTIEDEALRSRFLSRAHRPAEAPADRTRQLTAGRTDPEPSDPPSDRSHGLGAIYEISQAINSVLDPDTLLETVMDLAIAKLDADRGLVILFDGPGGEMRARVARNMERETIDDAIAYSRHVVQEAAEGRPVLSFDAAHDDRFKNFRSVRMHGIRSLLCVPLLLRGDVVGTVYLDSRRAGIAFDENDLRFLEVFANMAALALHNAREFDGLRRENRQLREEVKGRFSYGNIIGKSPRMQTVFDIIAKVTESSLPVLVCGESGTGKELVARAIHFNGPRREAPFFAENCTALSETLLESELFGHVKGAFTGADASRPGLFEMASGGTLFLDEIGDMSVGMQGKVLRAIQEGEIRRVGGKRMVKVDVRILSATNKDLDALLRDGAFREDLFYRLNVVKVTLPPLRERKEDIPLLVDHFLLKQGEQDGLPAKRMDVDALSLILRYEWPGNIRELENEVRKLAVFTEGDVITIDSINRHHELFHKLTDLRQETTVESIEEVERKQIIRALQETAGHRGKAAQLLGISRATIFRKIKQYGVST